MGKLKKKRMETSFITFTTIVARNHQSRVPSGPNWLLPLLLGGFRFVVLAPFFQVPRDPGSGRWKLRQRCHSEFFKGFLPPVSVCRQQIAAACPKQFLFTISEALGKAQVGHRLQNACQSHKRPAGAEDRMPVMTAGGPNGPESTRSRQLQSSYPTPYPVPSRRADGKQICLYISCSLRVIPFQHINTAS